MFNILFWKAFLGVICLLLLDSGVCANRYAIFGRGKMRRRGEKRRGDGIMGQMKMEMMMGMKNNFKMKKRVKKKGGMMMSKKKGKNKSGKMRRPTPRPPIPPPPLPPPPLPPPTPPPLPTLPPTPTPMECSSIDRPLETIRTQSVVTLIGRPNDVTRNEISLLEILFASSYNSLISCRDGAERRIIQVQIRYPSRRRRRPRFPRRTRRPRRNLQETTSGLSQMINIARPFSLHYTVVIRCRGCTDDRAFNNDGIQRRHLYGEEEEKEISQRTMENNVDNKNNKSTTLTRQDMDGVFVPLDDQITNDIQRTLRRHRVKPFLSSQTLATRGTTKRGTTTRGTIKRGMTTRGTSTIMSCPDCQAPTPEEFTAVYDSSIQSLAASGSLRSIDAIQGIVSELLPVSCAPQSQLVETRVAIGISIAGGEPTINDLNILARAFQDTYNQINALNVETCDLNFRTVVRVVVESADVEFSRRRLETKSPTIVHARGSNGQRYLTTTTFNITGQPISLNLESSTFLFRVSFRCRGCDGEIFPERENNGGDGFRSRRRLVADHYPRSLLTFRPRQEATDCVCSPMAQMFQGPSRTEFTSAFANTVQSLSGDLSISARIPTNDATREIEPIPCSAEITNLQTDIIIFFSGLDVEAITDDEIVALERGVQQVYNGLIQAFCDVPLFRMMENVEIIGPPIFALPTEEGSLIIVEEGSVVPQSLGTLRRKMQQEEMTRLNTTRVTRNFGYNFRLSFRSRGSSDDTRPFDDGITRRLQSRRIAATIWQSRILQPELTDTCFCDTQPLDRRAPNIQEFEMALDAAVQSGDLNVPNLQRVTAITDNAPPTLSPSLFPLLLPSLVPSANPTDLPTLDPQSPSFFPSFSIVPTDLPTLDATLSQLPPSFPSLSVNPTDLPTFDTTLSKLPSSTNLPTLDPTMLQFPSSTNSPTFDPTQSQLPSFTGSPTLDDSTLSRLPSSTNLPTLDPTLSQFPPSTLDPTLSQLPSSTSSPTLDPTLSRLPSSSSIPTLDPTLSQFPSSTSSPTLDPTLSQFPSSTNVPTLDPTSSSSPSETFMPSWMPTILSGPPNE